VKGDKIYIPVEEFKNLIHELKLILLDQQLCFSVVWKWMEFSHHERLAAVFVAFGADLL